MKRPHRDSPRAYLSHVLILAIVFLSATYMGALNKPFTDTVASSRLIVDVASADPLMSRTYEAEAALLADLLPTMLGFGLLTQDLAAIQELDAVQAAAGATAVETSAAGFIWPAPASARITNRMTARHPKGIDIGLRHAPDSSIVAVADGVVEFAGGRACCGYGFYVIIDHGNGLQTLYSHLSRVDVYKGQHVSQGQHLGGAGTTGLSTGVHLHFEVRKHDQFHDPLDYLPPPPKLSDPAAN